MRSAPLQAIRDQIMPSATSNGLTRYWSDPAITTGFSYGRVIFDGSAGAVARLMSA